MKVAVSLEDMSENDILDWIATLQDEIQDAEPLVQSRLVDMIVGLRKELERREKR